MKKYLIPIVILSSIALAFGVYQIKAASGDTVWSGAGDGYVELATTTANWATVHSAVSGNEFNYTNATAIVGTGALVGASVSARRMYLPFDTSAIPTNAVITSATLYAYDISEINIGSDTYISVVQTSQEDSTSLTYDDYSKIDAVKGSDDITISNTLEAGVIKNVYKAFTLNATGRGWIKKEGETSNCGTTAGVTCLGIREGHDIENVDPTSDTIVVQMATSEDTSGTKDPYLVVTYTLPSAVPGNLNVTEKTLIVNSGTLQIKGN